MIFLLKNFQIDFQNSMPKKSSYPVEAICTSKWNNLFTREQRNPFPIGKVSEKENEIRDWFATVLPHLKAEPNLTANES